MIAGQSSRRAYSAPTRSYELRRIRTKRPRRTMAHIEPRHEHAHLYAKPARAGFGQPSLKNSSGLLDSRRAKRRQLTEFFVASLAEVSQGVQRAAYRHRAQLWQGLVR